MRWPARMALACVVLCCAACALAGYALGRDRSAAALATARSAARVDSLALAKARRALRARVDTVRQLDTVVRTRRVVVDRVVADSLPTLAPLLAAERGAVDAQVTTLRVAVASCDSLLAGEGGRVARQVEAATRALVAERDAARRRARRARVGELVGWAVAAAAILRR